MARFIGIHQGLLDDGDFLGLSHEGQRCWFLLRLDPRLGISGAGRIAWQSLLRVLDLSAQGLDDVIDELTHACFRYDRETGLVWLVKAFRWEPNSPMVRRSVITELTRLPRHSILLDWLDRYRSRFSQEELGVMTAYLETVSIPSRYRLDTVSRPISRTRRPDPTRPDPVKVPPSSSLRGTGDRSRQSAPPRADDADDDVASPGSVREILDKFQHLLSIEPTARDRSVASRLARHGVPVDTIEAAILPALLRKGSDPDRPRSLGYFAGIVEELQRDLKPGQIPDYLEARRDTWRSVVTGSDDPLGEPPPMVEAPES